MKKSMIIWAIALILVAVAVYTTYQYNNAPTPAPAPQTNEQTQTPSEDVVESIDAIDFTLTDLNGKEVKLSDYKGKNIYLNFWATWCGPCKSEMPYIELLHQETKDTDLVVLTVDLMEPKATLEKFMKDNNYTFPVLLDLDGEVGSIYQVQSIPLSLLIDKDFKIVSAHNGSMTDYEMLKEFVDQLKD